MAQNSYQMFSGLARAKHKSRLVKPLKAGRYISGLMAFKTLVEERRYQAEVCWVGPGGCW